MRASANLAASLILIIASFAGCIGDPSGGPATVANPSEEPASTVVVEPEPGVKVAENRGALKGTTVNDAQFPLKGVFIVLPGTDHTAVTDDKGNFLIVNVSVGVRPLRAEKSGFQVHEEDVEIRAGAVTNVSILMVPLEEKGAGLRPHTHDYWQDQTEITILDADIDPKTDPGGGYGIQPHYAYWLALATLYYPNCNCSNPAGWPVFLPDGAIILPGTGEIHVTFTWDPTMVRVRQMSLAYLSSDMPNIQSRQLFTAPKPSGATHVLRVNETMTDAGHQQFTLWRFWANAANPIGANYQPGWALAPFHAKIVIKKAAIWLEEPHKDFWKGQDTLTLLGKEQSRQRLGGGTLPIYQHDNEYGGFALPASAIVPPGTNKMRLTLEWKFDGGPTVAAADEHFLAWRAGNQAPRKTQLSDFHQPAPSSSAAGKKVWEFEVKPEQTDAYYQKRSNWFFGLWFAPYARDDHMVPDVRVRDVTLEVVVWRDSNYLVE